MAEKVVGSAGSRRRRWLFGWSLVLALAAAVFLIAGAQANPPEQSGFFELDKNAENNVSTVFLGSLGGNINASQTSFTVCQASNTNPSPLPITIQVDAEQMTVGAIANASGGGCTGAFKRTYSSVTRGVNGTTAASHGASGVSGYVTQIISQTKAGDDWDQVYAAVLANGSPSDTNPNPCSGPAWTGGADITDCDWIHDPDGKSVFTTGGSKDDLDINTGTAPNITHNWMWTDSSVPDADDITDAFAAKYQGPNAGDHQFLFFGADRTAVNGAKDMGFWFFKSPVSLNPDGTFNGQHTIGDILLLGTFTQGGAATSIRVFSWVGTGGDTNNVLQTGGAFGDCVPGGSSNGCNTVNNTTITSPWAYQSKISGSPANTLYAGALMEGGVDLTGLGLEGCFANFLAETRSSPEIGAQLKDFVLGKFETCGSSLATTPQDAADPPADLTDSNSNGLPDVSIDTGSVQVTDSAELNVNGTNSFSGTLSFHLCGPIASPDTCDTGGVPIALDGTNPVTANGTYHSVAATLTEAGRYCWRGDFTSDTQGVPDAHDSSTTECFEVLPVEPTLTTQAGDDVILGNTITDTASLTGTANQPGDNGGSDPGQLDNTYPSINATNGAPADGTITFTLFGPDDCTTVPTGFSAVDVSVSGDSTTAYTASFTPTAVGTYTWVAEYSGDNPNTNGAGPTGCPDANEEVTVTGTAQLSTAQDWLPNDTATLTGDTNLTGTLTFSLYNDGTCGADGGSVVYGPEQQTITDAASGTEFSTNNTTFKVKKADAGDYS